MWEGGIEAHKPSIDEDSRSVRSRWMEELLGTFVNSQPFSILCELPS